MIETVMIQDVEDVPEGVLYREIILNKYQVTGKRGSF